MSTEAIVGNDAEAIEHLHTCPGCSECDFLTAFYSVCDGCNRFGHGSTMTALSRDGATVVLCDGCLVSQEGLVVATPAPAAEGGRGNP